MQSDKHTCMHTHTNRVGRSLVWGQQFFFGWCCQICSSSEMHEPQWDTHTHTPLLKLSGLKSNEVNSERIGFRQKKQMNIHHMQCMHVCWVGEVNQSYESGKRETRGWKGWGQKEDNTERAKQGWYPSAHDTPLFKHCSGTAHTFLHNATFSLAASQLRHTLYFHSGQY